MSNQQLDPKAEKAIIAALRLLAKRGRSIRLPDNRIEFVCVVPEPERQARLARAFDILLGLEIC